MNELNTVIKEGQLAYKYMKKIKCSISLQIKTALRFHFTLGCH